MSLPYCSGGMAEEAVEVFMNNFRQDHNDLDDREVVYLQIWTNELHCLFAWLLYAQHPRLINSFICDENHGSLRRTVMCFLGMHELERFRIAVCVDVCCFITNKLIVPLFEMQDMSLENEVFRFVSVMMPKIG